MGFIQTISRVVSCKKSIMDRMLSKRHVDGISTIMLLGNQCLYTIHRSQILDLSA